MTFYSLQFAAFLAITFILYYLIPQKYRYIFLAFSGIVFYASHGIRFLIILMSVTLISYLAALFIQRDIAGRYILFLSVLSLLVLWFLFRPNGINHGIDFFSNGAAVGISFYALTAIAYIADVYNGRAERERNPLKYILFISFFPVVISGPIERANNLLSQIRRGNEFSYDLVVKGLRRILYGMFLKCLIADRVALTVNGIFNSYDDKTGAALLGGVILYGVQLYADFSGYTYLATGISMLFGFRVSENFAQPFFSTSIKEFWTRWHISLSSWFRDYIYIPLGGNKKGSVRKHINLLMTFLASGFWHGSGLQFLVWGLINGIFQILSSVMTPVKKQLRSRLKINYDCFSFRLLRIFITISMFCFSLIFFRASSLAEAVRIIKIMFNDFGFAKTLLNWLYSESTDFERVFILVWEIAVWFFVDLIHEKKISIGSWLEGQNKAFRWMVYMAACLILATGMLYNYGTDASTFIYAGF